jgi:hypothetical protein
MGEDELAILWLILGTLALFAMVFGIRYLRNKENMALIEKGIDPSLNRSRPAPYVNLKWGLLLIGSGVGLMLAYFITKYLLHDDENPALWFAFIAIGGGAGLIGSYRIEKKEVWNKDGV